jgi:hypothetical protein
VKVNEVLDPPKLLGSCTEKKKEKKKGELV